MNRLMVVTRVSCLLCFSLWLAGQIHAQQMPSKADKQYEMGMYEEAAQGYEQMISSTEDADITCYERLASCYVNTNNPIKAIETYEEAAMRYDMSANSYLKWAAALKKIGRNEEADEIVSFASVKDRSSLEAMTVDDEMGYEIVSVAFNSRGNEFAPAFFGNDIICVTDNYDALQVTGVSTSINELPHILMRVDIQTGKKQRLRGKLKDYINDGPSTYSADGEYGLFLKRTFSGSTIS